jgi:N-acetylglucosamine repressor
VKIDKSIINTLNKQNVLNIIRDNSPIFKAEIARLTNLSIPTVMKITDELISNNLVIETGKGESNGGKPPRLLEFNPTSYYIIGVEVEEYKILMIMMDLSAAIIYSETIPINVNEHHDVIIKKIIDSINNTIVNSGVPRNLILGIGIGMPGLLDKEHGTVLFSPDFKWENVNLVAPIKEKFNMNIIIDNVTRAMAMGEKWLGLGKNVDNFMCINLGYGIGASIVLNGTLYSGSSGSSGEFGHLTLEKNGPICDCGNYGCLEALASGNAITKKAKLFVAREEHSRILDLAGGNIDSIEAKTVFDAAKEGDGLAMEIVREATEYLGIAIAGMINFLDPELIILEGGVAQAGEILTNNIQKIVGRRQMKCAGRRTKILVSQLGKNAAAIGAASFILQEFIENGGEW